jgi:hypothetical protein
MQEFYPARWICLVDQCGHADEFTRQADDVRSQGVKRTLRLRATTSGNAPQADVGHEIDGPGVSLLSTATGQETHIASGNGLTFSYKK